MTANPLSELDNEQWNENENLKYFGNCFDCRQKRQSSNNEGGASKRRKADEAKLQSIDGYSWEQVLAMIDEL
jgi:hypothetical protein